MATSSRSYNATHGALAFPLGGIGTGNVSLGARGELRDWEIFNAPAKGNFLPNTFFAIRLQSPDQPPIMRVLEGSASAAAHTVTRLSSIPERRACRASPIRPFGASIPSPASN